MSDSVAIINVSAWVCCAVVSIIMSEWFVMIIPGIVTFVSLVSMEGTVEYEEPDEEKYPYTK